MFLTAPDFSLPMHRIAHLIVLAVTLGAGTAHTQTPPSVTRTPLRADHPLIGAWRIDIPEMGCHEVYFIQPDGTLQVTSGTQAAESDFQISDQPSARGFYKWVDRITSDNGKPDCLGSIMTVGHVATNYILMHPSGSRFFMCEKEEVRSCVGPFVRHEGI